MRASLQQRGAWKGFCCDVYCPRANSRVNVGQGRQGAICACFPMSMPFRPPLRTSSPLQTLCRNVDSLAPPFPPPASWACRSTTFYICGVCRYLPWETTEAASLLAAEVRHCVPLVSMPMRQSSQGRLLAATETWRKRSTERGTDNGFTSVSFAEFCFNVVRRSPRLGGNDFFGVSNTSLSYCRQPKEVTMQRMAA